MIVMAIKIKPYRLKNASIKLKRYMKDIIFNLKKSDTSQIQLTTAVNFMFSKDNDEDCAMYSKNDNLEIVTDDKANEVAENIFQSLLSRYQN